MATCLLRSVINPRNYRAFTHKLGLTSISQVTRRRLHISTIVPRKFIVIYLLPVHTIRGFRRARLHMDRHGEGHAHTLARTSVASRQIAITLWAL